MLFEELEWKLGGRMKSVCIVLLALLLMWGYAGGANADGALANGAYAGGMGEMKRYLLYYITCWERLCRF